VGDNLTIGVRLTADGKDLVGVVQVSAAELEKLGTSTRHAGNEAAHLNQQNKSLANTFNVLKGAVAGLGLAAVARELFTTGTALQRVQNSLEFATGSTQAAKAEYEYLRQTANRLGLDLNTASLSFTKLAAAAQGTSMQGQGARDIFNAVSGAATVMGLSAAEADGALLAISQMIGKGTVAAEELRGQLGERLPGAFQIASRAMGVSTAELGKMLEQGQVISDDFLPKFAAELERSLGKSLPSAMRSANAELNRFSTAWLEFKQGVTSSGFLSAAASALEGMTSALRTATQHTEDLYAASKALLLGATLTAGGYALGASIAFIGTAATGAATAVALLNRETLLFLGGAALQKLETLGKAGKGGLLGMALWGGWEIGEFLNRNTQIQRSVQAVLDPVFRFFDRSDGTMLSKLDEKLAELKSGKAIRSSLAFDQMMSGSERAAAIADAERQAADIRRRNGSGPATTNPAKTLPYKNELTSDEKEFLNGLRTKDEQIRGEIKRLYGLLEQDKITIDEYNKRRKQLAADLTKANAPKTAKETDFSRFQEQSAERLALLRAEGAATDSLTETEKWAIKVKTDLLGKNSKLTESEKHKVSVVLEAVKAQDEANRANADALKFSQDRAQLAAKEWEDINKQVEAKRHEVELIGLTAEQLKALTLGRIDEQIALKTAEQASASSTAGRQAEAAMIGEQIKQLEELRGLTKTGHAKQAGADSAKKTEEEWKKVFHSVESVGKQTFVQVFSRDGTSAAEAFGRAIKTSVVDLLYELTMKKWIIQLEAAVTGTGGIAGGGGGGGLGGIFDGIFKNIGTANTYGTNIGSEQTAMLAAQWHTGGGPGDTPAAHRTIPAAVFATAPRFHTGIGPGERAAVITDEESVLTPGQMRMLAPVGALSGSNVTINVIESPGGGGKQQQRSDSGGNKIIDVLVEQVKGSIAADISMGSGSIPAALGRTYGLNRSAGMF
jgi:tape measure domain-containing protein